MTWHIYLFLTILAWGGYNVLFKFATSKMDFSLLLFIAGVTQALSVIPWVAKAKTVHYSATGVGISMFMGILVTLGGITFFTTYKLGAPVSVATPVYGVGVLLLSAVVGIIIGEPITPRWFIGMLLGAGSIVLLTIK